MSDLQKNGRRGEVRVGAGGGSDGGGEGKLKGRRRRRGGEWQWENCKALGEWRLRPVSPR